MKRPTYPYVQRRLRVIYYYPVLVCCIIHFSCATASSGGSFTRRGQQEIRTACPCQNKFEHTKRRLECRRSKQRKPIIRTVCQASTTTLNRRLRTSFVVPSILNSPPWAFARAKYQTMSTADMTASRIASTQTELGFNLQQQHTNSQMTRRGKVEDNAIMLRMLAEAKKDLSDNDRNGKNSLASGKVQNFRYVLGMEGIAFRCGEIDRLGNLFFENGALSLDNDSIQCSSDENDKRNHDEASHILLKRTGLILDLRSPSERNEDLAQAWMEEVNAVVVPYDSGRPPSLSSLVQTQDGVGPTVLRMDLLSPRKLFTYMEGRWFSPTQKIQAIAHKTFDMDALHRMRMDMMNDKGLPGLYEAILETAQEDLCYALRCITHFFEQNTKRNDERNAVVIHCVQGKDRTGLVSILCQAVLGIDDSNIIRDYCLSDPVYPASRRSDGSAAPNTTGKLDMAKFRGAPREAAIITLIYLKERYGSINPGYLDAIGFSSEWRQRFFCAVQQNNQERRNQQLNQIYVTKSRRKSKL